MMDQNVFQLITDMAYVDKIGQEFHTITPFAQFDVLAPDESGLVWQLTKRLLSVPRNIFTSRVDQKSSGVIESSIQISVQ